jgi:hypothetical protein
MKLSIKPLAIAVAVGLASTAAHAQLASPSTGTAAPALTGLYVSIWDSTSQHSELVNLSYAYSALLPSTGNLTPNSATAPYVTAANPAGSGSVLQLDFGVLPGFASTFGTPGSTTSYMVLAANGQLGADFTATPATAATLTSAALNTLATNITAEVSAWQNGGTGVANSGTAIDLTATQQYSAIAGANKSGSNGLVVNFSGTVGTALDFFNLVPGAARSTVKLTQYANTQGAGFWFLSSTGDLTYNVAAATSPVPLPAAVWLLVSGLAGLGAIGRRRNAAAA